MIISLRESFRTARPPQGRRRAPLKRTLNPSVQRLEIACRGIKNQEASHQVDKARDIMRSSLPLLDEAIRLLEESLRKGEK